tara:strand:- start:1452 stop:1868 length:417 start_codon:yes stop_codon:yes gene_type:complete
MKERFWFIYYWAMLGYLCLGLFVLVVSLLTFQDRTMSSGLICERQKLTNIYHGSACAQGNNVPSIIFDINEYLFFDFIEYNFKDGKSRITGLYSKEFFERKISMDRYIGFDNGYPLLLILMLTLIRWISIGKHIWQRP